MLNRRAAARVDLSLQDFETLARCVDSIGTQEFAAHICAFCVAVGHADTVFLSAFFDQSAPVPIYTNHGSSQAIEALSTYTRAAYLLDPFYRRFLERRGDEVTRLGDIAPDHFRQSEYYLRFYKALELEDECGIMVHIGPASAIVFSFGVHRAGGRIDASRLQVALPLIIRLVRRHWTSLSPERAHGVAPSAPQLQAAFERFGQATLSPRERQIVQLVLKGHSTKAIARAFDNSPETIKVHRRRIYSKLGVNSQAELLSLFLASMAEAGGAGTTSTDAGTAGAETRDA